MNFIHSLRDLIESQASAEPHAVTGISLLVTLAAAIIPPGLACFTRRLSIIALCLGLSVGALIVFVRPGLIGSVVIVGAYLGGMIAALNGLRARRRQQILESRLTKLEADLTMLQTIERRRFLSELATPGTQSQPKTDLARRESES